MKIKPLFDRVVIKPNMEKNSTNFGLVLPETSIERPQIGKVVAVGDGENMDNVEGKMKLKIDDVVIFNKYAGVDVKLDDDNYVVMRQIDIIGVVDEREDNC